MATGTASSTSQPGNRDELYCLISIKDKDFSGVRIIVPKDKVLKQKSTSKLYIKMKVGNREDYLQVDQVLEMNTFSYLRGTNYGEYQHLPSSSSTSHFPVGVFSPFPSYVNSGHKDH